jgi:hypothetical protein
VNWVQKRDNELFDRFIAVDIAYDAVLLTDILQFCRICQTLADRLGRDDANQYRQNVAFIRRKWLLRIAFYTGPLPVVKEPSLPSELVAELEELGSFGRAKPQLTRRNLSDPFIRHIAYQVLKTSNNASGPAEQVLAMLSSSSHDSAFSESILEIGLAGYVSRGAEQLNLWTWRLRILLARLDEVVFYVSEDRVPSEISGWILHQTFADEEKRDSTPQILARVA